MQNENYQIQINSNTEPETITQPPLPPFRGKWGGDYFMELKMTNKKSIVQNRPTYTLPLKVTSLQSGVLKEGMKIEGLERPLGKCCTGKKPSTDNKLPSTLETLKFAVLTICEDDQQKLLDFLLLQKMNRKQTSAQDRKLALLMDSLSTELGKLLGNSSRVFPLPQLPDVRKMFKQVEALMLDLKMSECNTQDTKAFYNVIARVLVQHANAVSISAKIPVTMKLVLQTNTTLHALLDNNYPGYLAAGLMRSVLNASRNGIVNDGEEDD